jgi:hypothetical protein
MSDVTVNNRYRMLILFRIRLEVGQTLQGFLIVVIMIGALPWS